MIAKPFSVLTQLKSYFQLLINKVTKNSATNNLLAMVFVPITHQLSGLQFED